MKTAPANRNKSGFTLVELIVSIAILSLILITLAKAIGYVSQLWVNGVGVVDNYTKARNILTVMDRDIQQMVLRPDVSAFVDGTAPTPGQACAFYTNVEGGVPTGDPVDGRTVSLVRYMLNPQGQTDTTSQTTLGRVNYGMNFTKNTDTPLLNVANTSLTQLPLTQLPTASTTNTDTVATGVIRFQWQFVDGSGNIITPTSTTPFAYDFTAPSAPANCRAVIISVLVLNNSAYPIATANSTVMTKLQNDFPNILPGTATNQSFSQYWNTILNPTTGTLDSTLPAPIRSGLQVFQRYIPLPVTAP